ncbi:Polysaccharide pyruvyl transferase [Pseudobutyrivibrio sp. OR37]|uniref:polysaccharide pyruvyl transferase family protein n=1 Tax=Pseudobutyrivibrio sp. OR37 TaxID=1798186 RepID=UPI0008EFB294|nr:polysaccharide pyruvyl transferase family protein [Pseudobutyrivibrio sp. OR37]SFI04058.1 Polysaccharide pyruvyl transferase [Pseudobutyrivibrio sp. OR37]
MKKVGITTHYTNSCNYGGVLQAYALCTVINNLGEDAKQICYVPKNESMVNRINRAFIEHRFVPVLKNQCISSINNLIGKIINSDKKIAVLRKSFNEFRFSIPHTNIIYDENTIDECDDFDIYITGSDQVWNLTLNDYYKKFYWLTFVKSGIKASYAASISSKNIPNNYKNLIKKWLYDYDYISVREKSDVNNLTNIINDKNIEWVMDPTLLLETEQWEKIAEPNSYQNEKYVFCYFLGNSISARKRIKLWAQNNNYKIITIPYMLGQFRCCDMNFGDERLFDVSPERWLALIRDADIVCTDSFHAVVFSLIFHKNFIVFRRTSDRSKESMNERLYSLLNMTNCENRIVSRNNTIDEIVNRRILDYNYIDEKIKKEKIKSINYLKNIIG